MNSRTCKLSVEYNCINASSYRVSIDSFISFNQEVFTQKIIKIHQAYFALKVDNQGHFCYFTP